MSTKIQRKKRKMGLPFIFLIVVLAFGFFTYKSVELEKERQALLATKSELEEELVSENDRTEQLNVLQSYMQTLNYIEDLAREKLGLVYKDEIIYKIEDDDEN